MRYRAWYFIVGCICLIGLALFVYFRNGNLSPKTSPDSAVTAVFAGMSATTSPLRANVETSPQDYLRYSNATYRFMLFYPPKLQVSTYDEGGGASTIVFESADHRTGFQIFVVPYTGGQVTASRLRLDEPSGVVKDPTAVVIDNTKATMFFGKNTIMGDTREVWFIKNGYLYEVTTYKELDSLLATVMQTWRFQ